MHVERLGDGPIIDATTCDSIGSNIQGPSLITAPPWLAEPLGAYYLYFADHKGSYIRLAYADALTGPWQVYRPGALQLADSCFPTEPPEATAEELARLRELYRAHLGASYSLDEVLADAVTPHIASPDVHVDVEAGRVVMYFHGLDSLGVQVTRAATSTDGINFVAAPELLGGPYLRVFSHDDWFYGLAMPGQFVRSRDGLTAFEPGAKLFQPEMRHSALWVHDGVLGVFWTRVGDAPESILCSRIELTDDWMQWTESDAEVVLEPEFDWEGSELPREPSRRSTAPGRVNQLRDPAIFVEGDHVYLLYAVAGESGIAMARVHST